jgi:ferredoxin-fold anticodon binding domain-containing protein
VEEELQKVVGRQVPIKTRTGGRHLDFINEVRPGVVVLTTNADGSGRVTILAVDCIESFTAGGASGSADGAAPNWKQ